MRFGEYALCGLSYGSNQNDLANRLIDKGVVFSEMPNSQVNQVELAANLINKEKKTGNIVA